MIGLVRDRLDAFFGRGRFSTAVPVMDGRLSPNGLLERAPVIAAAPELDNVLSHAHALYFSSGRDLCRLTSGGVTETLESFAAPISALAVSADGGLAIGFEGAGVVVRGGRHDGVQLTELGGTPLACTTALLFADADMLIIASGSEDVLPSAYKQDVMSLGRSGSIWRVGLASKRAEKLAGGLGYPYGLAFAAGGELLVAESWRHRVLKLQPDTASKPLAVLDQLPGYPARIAACSAGGFWLALFAPRNQLIEFVLHERGYCRRMMREVAPDYWVAPALRSGGSFKEVLQAGAVKQMGMMKPWAPSQSFGLVVQLDEEMQIKASWHSRADGSRHGVTAICEHGGKLIAAAKGPGLAVALNVSNESAGGMH